MLHAAVAAGCRYDEDEVLAYTAAVASRLALQPQSEVQAEVGWRADAERVPHLSPHGELVEHGGRRAIRLWVT